VSTSQPLEEDPRRAWIYLRAITEGVHEGLFVIRAARMEFVNPSLARMCAGSPADVEGRPFLEMVAPQDRDFMRDIHRRRLLGEPVPDEYEFSLLALDGTHVPVFLRVKVVIIDGERISVGTVTDISARREIEARRAETRAIQAEDEAAQATLAIPVVEIWEGVLVLPVVGHLNAARADALLQRALSAIVERGAREILVDVTGVPVFDERIAGYFDALAQAVGLLGASASLVGLSPQAAKALVSSGVGAPKWHAAGSLRDGLRNALRRMGLGIVPVRR
jgi:PAS domain S-box-containing protein